MPGRQIEIGVNYRYGFYGKEKDNEVKGEGNELDFGMRIYDPRLGRFLSVDPLTRDYPMLTAYQISSNSPIALIDLDGLEGEKPKGPGSNYWYVGYIDKLQYNGTLSENPIENIPTAVGNAGINVLNFFPAVWNSGVQNVQNLREGHFWSSLYRDLKQVHDNTANAVGGSIDYTIHTPIKQQLVDFGKTLDDPHTLETALTILATTKLKVPEVGSTVRLVSFSSFRLFGGIYQNEIIGTWVDESITGWSQRAIEYQEYVTGVKAGKALEVNGVRFDGMKNNTLLEAKNGYDKWVRSKTGEFYNSFKGKQGLVDQARRQIEAAKGANIEWHFASEKTLNATKTLFEKNGITSGIKYVYDPPIKH
jgi:RHS repeat-associated protein